MVGNALFVRRRDWMLWQRDAVRTTKHIARAWRVRRGWEARLEMLARPPAGRRAFWFWLAPHMRLDVDAECRRDAEFRALTAQRVLEYAEELYELATRVRRADGGSR